MKKRYLVFIALMLYAAGCAGPLDRRGGTASPPPSQSGDLFASTQSSTITPRSTNEFPVVTLDTIELSLSPARWLGDNDYLVSGPTIVSVQTPGNVVQVEFYGQRSGHDVTIGPLFVDHESHDGWTWDWQTPQDDMQIWAEAVYADGKRAKSPKLRVSLDVPQRTPSPNTTLIYTNLLFGYTLEVPGDWVIDEYGMSQASKEVTFNPPDAEPFSVYLSILLDGRTLDQIRQVYTEHFPNIPPVEVEFAGQYALQYRLAETRLEMFVPLPAGVFLFSTDRAGQLEVQQMLASFRYPIPVGTVQEEPQRILFAPGATSSTVSGTIVGIYLYTYVLGASEGQTMDVQVTSPRDNVWLTISGQDGVPLVRSHVGRPTQWRGVLTATQDYFITLSVEQPVADSEPYDLRISITD